MVRLKKIVPIILVLMMIFGLFVPTYASAESIWFSTVVEQCRATVPNVNMYFYPLDIDGDIIAGLSGSNTSAVATLGNDKLSMNGLTNAKDEGTCYIVAVNTSAADTGFGYLQSVMNSLKYWLESMGEKDRLMLLSFTDEVTVLLDGTENKTAAVTGIESLSTDTSKTDASRAIKKAIELSENAGEGFPERHVLVMFDDGKFLEQSTINIENLIASLLDANLPMYAVVHDKNYEELYTSMAVDTNGAEITTNGYSCEDEAKVVKSYIDSAYVLKLRTPTNRMNPTERHMEIELSHGGLNHEVSFGVVIDSHIPDETAPTVKKAEFDEENRLKIWFSEDVLGADKVANYILKTEADKEVSIEDADYDRSNFVAVLELKNAPIKGTYRLQFRGITDNSEEENAVAYAGNEKWQSVEYNKGSYLIWIIAGAVVLVAAILTIIIVSNKKKAKEEEEERRRREEEEKRIAELERMKAAGQNAIPTVGINQGQRPVIVEDRAKGFAVTLNIVLPNGIKKKNQIAVTNSYVVGRKADRCDYAINDEKISSRHFSLSVSFDKLMISDLNSTNGTYVNGIKIDRPRVLQNGDTVVAGATKIVISF